MFSAQAFENARPGGIPVLEVIDGDVRRRDGQRRFVPLQRTELQGEVIGPLAALRLVQVFAFTRDQETRTVEAVYRFPLPGDAAVTGVRVAFGEVVIEASLKRREEAEAEYQKAVAEGKQAALAMRESPDVFSLMVAGIRPDEAVRVETTFVQLAHAEGGGWSLRVPLTTAPRYVRSDEVSGRHAHGQPLVLLRDPGHRFTLDLLVRGADRVTSATHDLDVRPATDGVHVALVGGEVLPDRDCVLAWRAAEDPGGSPLHVYLHDQAREGHVYFLALVTPPRSDRAEASPREVVLLVDHSGSMSGAKWEAADWAVQRFLGGLGPDERFALGVFHNVTHWFSSAPVPGDEEHIAQASRFLREQRDSGGTELGVALEQALCLARTDGDLARHVLVLTDAQVTDAGRILQLADAEAQRRDRRRISVLCIDAAPNAFLVHELVRRGGGLARFLTSDPEEDDVTTALDDVLADWARPTLTDLRLVVNREALQLAGHVVGRLAEGTDCAGDLGDLPGGRPLWVVGRVPRGGGPLEFALCSRARQVGEARVDVEAARHWCPAIASLYGARRILELEYLAHAHHPWEQLVELLQRLGYHREDALGQARIGDRVYSENARREVSDALRALLAKESLTYGLASSEASFVAVRQEAGRPVQATVPVAGALPAGWSDGFLGPASYSRSGSPLYSGIVAARSSLGSLGEALACTSRPDDIGGRLLSQAQAPAMSPPAGRRPRVLESRPAAPGEAVVFAGVPRFGDAHWAVLYDSAHEAPDRLPPTARLGAMTVRPTGRARARLGAEGVMLLLFVGDLAAPVARVRLSDVLQADGRRPLNVFRREGERVVLVLEDRDAAWAKDAPEIRVVLEW